MPKEIPLELQKLKQEQRNMLRQEYWKLMTKPPASSKISVGEVVFDSGHQRYFSMVATRDQYFKGNPWNSFLLFAVFFVPLGVTTYFVKKSRDEHEHKLRTGQIAYADRQNKSK